MEPEDAKNDSLTIRHLSNDYPDFTFRRANGIFQFWRHGRNELSNSVHWNDVTMSASEWARQIKLASAPDLWQQSRLRRQLLKFHEDADENTPFSQSEVAEVAAQLKEIKEPLRNGDQGKLTAHQLEMIEARLDEAEESAHRAQGTGG